MHGATRGKRDDGAEGRELLVLSMGKNARIKALGKKKTRPVTTAERVQPRTPRDGAAPDTHVTPPERGGDGEKTANAQRLLDRAAIESSEMRFENAAKLLQAAIRIDPGNVNVMDALAEVFLELGEPQRAEQCFLHSVAVQPDGNYTKYMYLAQLTSDYEQACSYIERAMDIMQRQRLANTASSNADQVSALCSAVELLLGISEQVFSSSNGTFNERSAAAIEALDRRAELALQQALELDPEGFEPMLTLANVRLSQGKSDEAKQCMLHIHARMKPLLQKMLDHDITVQEQETMVPSVDFRIAVGKQLCELEAWQEAAEVFDSVLVETDRNVEVWFLSALCLFQNGDVEECCEMLCELDALRKSPEGFEGMLDFSLAEELEQNAKEYLSQLQDRGEGQQEDVDMKL